MVQLEFPALAESHVLEICAGAGGQALGLEGAGFGLAAAVELDKHACATLQMNRPHWTVLQGDVRDISGCAFRGVELLAGGVPCPPFSVAGRKLGADDERDLFPEALRLAEEVRPLAIMLENVRGLAGDEFAPYRASILEQLHRLGYEADYRVLNASDFGLPQLRPRFVLVAMRPRYMVRFRWPGCSSLRSTVGDALHDLMGSKGWPGTNQWRKRASGVGPTLVGGSKKHGGPDLGPTRARTRWALLGVDGLGIANEPPGEHFPFEGMPRLTVRMAARLQGFPDTWQFSGAKTPAYRQVGNAFPPPVAQAVGTAIRRALTGQDCGAYPDAAKR